MIDLRAPRVVAITDRGHTYKLTVAPPSRKLWFKYFEGVISTSENVGGNRVDSFDSTGARLALIAEILTNAEGYTVPDGALITDLPNWRELIPAPHRLTVGNVLLNVPRSESDATPIVLGQEVITLETIWYRGGESMTKVTGLQHNFNPPTSDQQRRYNRDLSRSKVIGGSRTGKTLWLGAQATLATLYDELIVSVDGYSINGQPLGDDREQIIASMDTYHKVAAAEALFSPAAPAIEEAE